MGISGGSEDDDEGGAGDVFGELFALIGEDALFALVTAYQAGVPASPSLGNTLDLLGKLGVEFGEDAANMDDDEVPRPAPPRPN